MNGKSKVRNFPPKSDSLDVEFILYSYLFKTHVRIMVNLIQIGNKIFAPGMLMIW